MLFKPKNSIDIVFFLLSIVWSKGVQRFPLSIHSIEKLNGQFQSQRLSFLFVCLFCFALLCFIVSDPIKNSISFTSYEYEEDEKTNKWRKKIVIKSVALIKCTAPKVISTYFYAHFLRCMDMDSTHRCPLFSITYKFDLW